MVGINRVKKIGVFSVLLLFSSCLKGDCEIDKKYALAVECLQIITQRPSSSAYNLKSEGIHLFTKRKCICIDETRWLGNYSELLEIGDTIIKRKGELRFSFHKKDTIITVDWRCEEPDVSEIRIRGEVIADLTVQQLRDWKMNKR
ncbi:hypothetical protein M2306_003173 [Myroides gitamensis]|uniref:hypothetical protein n=1 Tax=Myroides odoratus TaxID=256 RepID=UPI002166ED50|nr:hypothetical protein [Myroides odoratus]MCS4239422.1 hypothetical protein [Myroides odoratus]MDH6602479.1 hypothetical protein [Myroides gitamensis]